MRTDEGRERGSLETTIVGRKMTRREMTTRMKNNGDENDSNPYCRYTTWSLKQDKEESVEEKATQQSDHQIFFKHTNRILRVYKIL